MATEKAENNSGIPQTDFVEAVDEFMKKPENESAEAVLRRFDELHSKYKFMEYNLNTKKARLKGQIPDIRTSLDIVKHLQSKKDSEDPLESRFLLSDHLFAKAKIPPTEKVCLWLGFFCCDLRDWILKIVHAVQYGLYMSTLQHLFANVMLEYTLDDADTLLEKNLGAAIRTLAQVEEDLGFLRDQMTTLEVNMARVYNWDVKRRQAEKAVKS